MGLTAKIYCTTRTALTQRQVHLLASRLAEAVGPGAFDIDRIAKLRALSLDPRIAKRVNVNIALRYYGPGYERGNWPLIGATLIWLKNQPKIEAVHYGSDADDSAELVTYSYLDTAWQHWAANGNLPYETRHASAPCRFCLIPVGLHSRDAAGDYGTCPVCGATVRGRKTKA